MSSILDELVEHSPEVVSMSAGAKQTLVLGLDVGTSGVRAAFFDEHGDEVAAVKIGRGTSLLSDFTELDPAHLVDEVI